MFIEGTARKGHTKEDTMGMSNDTTASKATSTPAPTAGGDQMWLGQFIYLDGETFVHICRSKEDAFQALADQEELTPGEGQTVEELIDDRFAESDLISFNVLPVDSSNLESVGEQMWLAQLIRWDGANFVHVCRSKEDAYQVLADQEDLAVGEGQTAEQVVADELEDSGEVIYVVAPADSTNL